MSPTDVYYDQYFVAIISFNIHGIILENQKKKQFVKTKLFFLLRR